MAKRITGALCAALMLALASPAVAQRTLTIGAQTPPSALDPHFHNTTNNTMMLMQIFERLFEVDNHGVPQPRLAVSMRAIDDLTWEVKLRAGPFQVIYANGGFTKMKFWVQMAAAIFGKKVVVFENEGGPARARVEEGEALGEGRPLHHESVHGGDL